MLGELVALEIYTPNRRHDIIRRGRHAARGESGNECVHGLRANRQRPKGAFPVVRPLGNGDGIGAGSGFAKASRRGSRELHANYDNRPTLLV